MYRIRDLTDTVQGGRLDDKMRGQRPGFETDEPLGVNNVPTHPLGSK